jgi:Fic family protein
MTALATEPTATATHSPELEHVLQLRQEWEAVRPTVPFAVQQQQEHDLVQLTYHSNAIEGNTLSLMDTRVVVLDGLTVGGKKVVELLEACNHAAAFRMVLQASALPDFRVTESLILQLHSTLLRGIWDDQAGRYRSVNVRVAGSQSVFPNPLRVPERMHELISEHPTGVAPFDAARLHYAFVSIHPFADGNGRTARLLLNAVLLHNGYPTVVVPFEWRTEYLNVLEQAQCGRGEQPYYTFMYRCMAKSLREAIDFAHS